MHKRPTVCVRYATRGNAKGLEVFRSGGRGVQLYSLPLAEGMKLQQVLGQRRVGVDLRSCLGAFSSGCSLPVMDPIPANVPVERIGLGISDWGEQYGPYFRLGSEDLL